VTPQAPFTHAGALAFAAEQVTVAQEVPQLVGVLIAFSQPFDATASQSMLPAGQATQAPLEQVWLWAHTTGAPHWPSLPQV
jgi:hypothetical protein